MIYLAPEVRSGLGEDTFWTWFHREIPSSFDVPERMGPNDVLLQYAVLGPSPVQGGRKIALCWELYPEMQKMGLADNADKIERMKRCAAESDIVTVTSRLMLEFFPTAQVAPIGVDTDLFRPRDKQIMRDKHGIGDCRTGFWCGTKHPMKGYERLLDYRQRNPEIQWIEVLKEQNLPQQKLAELMSCADFILATGRLRPYFMVEWEAMACDVPMVDISGLERDFIPSQSPRNDVMKFGWSRHDAKKYWMNLCGV